jgi:hypothetical protein
MYKKFVMSIDANDNGDKRVQSEIPINTALWDRVARENPSWYESAAPE